jgi:hypothetical protein
MDMLPFQTILELGLFYGAILSVVMTAFILATLAWRPMILLGDAPAEVQAALGPMSPADERFKRAGGAGILLFIVALLAMALAHLARLGGGAPAFADAALLVFVILMTFNLVDLVLIDWLLLVIWRPRFMLLPGADRLPAGLDATGGYAHHFRGFLKGTAGSAVAAIVFAAAAVAVSWLANAR